MQLEMLVLVVTAASVGRLEKCTIINIH